MLMMLVLRSFFCEIFDTYFLLNCIYFLISKTKYLFSLNTMICIFNKLFILHHFVYIFSDPGLLFISHIHSHITEQLLFCKCLKIFWQHFNIILPDNLIDDERPLQLVNKRRKFCFYFFSSLFLLFVCLHPLLQKVFRKADVGTVE